jgi:hypothetical protein
MEKMIDMEEWIKSLNIQETKYFATYDEFGNIRSVIPATDPSLIDGSKIEIDSGLGVDIITGKENLFFYKINLDTSTIQKIDELAELQGLDKIDDVLHRVIDKTWSDIKKPDVSITYMKEEKLLVFNINPLLKTFEWHGEQDMIFLVTEYNDPNILLKTISFNVNELVRYPQRFSIELPEKFSVYTRRLFKNYTIEVV